MYSNEIDELMRSKGYVITTDDYFRLNPIQSSQITHVHYDACTNRFQIYTNDGYEWDFEVINSKEQKEIKC